MTKEELADLDTGDIVTHSTGDAYVIVGRDTKGHCIAVRKILVTNPSEWALHSKSQRIDYLNIRGNNVKV